MKELQEERRRVAQIGGSPGDDAESKIRSKQGDIEKGEAEEKGPQVKKWPLFSRG